MNSTVVFLALHFVQILTYYGCFVLSLNLRFRKKYPLILGIGVTIALSILKCSDIIAEHDAAVFLIQANQLILLINVIILFKDSLKLKLFYFVLMITASAAAEYLTRAAAVLRGDKIVWDFTVWHRPELIPYHYMMCFFFVLMNLVTTYFWNKKVRYKKIVGINIYILVSINYVFFILGAAVIGSLHIYDKIIYQLGMIISGGTGILLCILWNWQAQKEELQREIMRVSYLMEQEKVEFDDLEEQVESMAHLRHEWNNCLTVVYYLLDNEADRDEALQVLDELKKKM
ncbi:hypothetical protein [Murimonas intestini]|uniref:SpoOB alpha-helical domain-containing protein n=1 Tax=Murimonas intestini TaxID=1337051 RepID=A0AB73T3Q2_9FIRM|nr:hypothetical protein [Murimonas intestini]MCR1841067.1 hypothetical protein [Murimonas intestini]MCR1865815.1 hypothetical protein [Murimonas intestini]MCR1883235.1 hypothetical protein [Murimonas intestini]